MLKILDRFFAAPPDAKASRVQSSIALYFGGHPVWTPRDYAALAREGFSQNAIVHRAVRLIAEAAASLPLILKRGGAERRHAIRCSLLARPNPRAGRRGVPRELSTHLLLAGQRLCRGGDGRRMRCASCMRCGPTA